MRVMKATSIALLSVSLLAWLVGPAHARQMVNDVRVLIDISGSMKQNDPRNLRRPALRLLVGLLPKGTRAGVWTFARSVKARIPLGQVDQRWKRKALAAASRIGSPGQRTDIAAALKRATRDWKTPAPNQNRHVVLLTDGMVDISRDEKRNEASRLFILDELLPRLTELGVQIHTIALSKHADHELLETLSRESGGWFEEVEDADRLQRVFLRMFEKVSKPDTVPLRDNRFIIDRSIQEATLLLFCKDCEQTRLVMPGGGSFDREHKPDNVAWSRDEGYELITITHPQAGKWKIRAAVDPDNRVMVVTNLKMRASDLPNVLVAGEQLPFTAEFLNNGTRITRKAFLDVIEADVTSAPLGTQGKAVPLMDDGGGLDDKAEDGLFSVVLTAVDEPGLLEVVASARASTFRRERRQTVSVTPPAEVSVDQGVQPVSVSVALQDALVDLGSVDVEAWLDGGGGKKPIPLRGAGPGRFQASFSTDTFRGMAKLVVEIQTKSKRGNPISWRFEDAKIKGLLPDVAEVAEPVPVPAAKAAVAKTDWGRILLLLGLGNGLLMVLGGLAWWLLRRRRATGRIVLDDGAVTA